MNDLLRTDVFTRQSPETVAAACIMLAARVHRVPLPSRPHWYHVFDMDTQQLTEIAESALQLYRRSKPDAVALERIVDDLRVRQTRMRGRPLVGTPGSSTPQQGTFSPVGSRTNSPHGKTAAAQPSVGVSASTEVTAVVQTGSPRESVLAPPASNGRQNSGADKENMAVKTGRGRDSGDDVTMLDSERVSAYASPRDHDVKTETRNKLASYYRQRERYRSHSRSPSLRRHRDSKSHKKSKDRRSKKRDPSLNGKSRYRSRSRSPKRSKSSRRHRDRSGSVSLDRHYKSLTSSRKRHTYDTHSRR